MILSRRKPVARSLGAFGRAAIAAWPHRASVRAGFLARRQLGLGIVLYMPGDTFEKDPAGTLMAIARIGYRGIEGFFDDVARADVQASMQRSRLICNSVAIMPRAPKSG